ncbi:MAP kinase-interacting serine/threonine-protein kinase mnk-1 [Caenorhabditis elegans]|uniref:Isoform a of MAP kinase-interacting serine/threonine-protein kinase mnk-1 n=1 Tax=Caenorhabditis elegans TaxID=6239 RepID=Q8I113-2|nr:MAP kinase-interacting serine/threonine-protein kinase mnk-1 [Caenorhabditis elegans]CAA90665.2 MAP kinase-interacting serine/threonine-protein kinase mnk-1 [Caenorhabditis elegans]|eukprot:NP_496272.2 MAP kinase-interacting serine/threonine-protein kinase mnk-1 [Caenorhabditis elegans]
MTILHAGYPQSPVVHFGRHHNVNINQLNLNHLGQVDNIPNNSAVGGGGAAFHHLHTSAATPRHVATSEFYDDEEATSPRGGIEIGAGGGKMMANLRRHRQRERETYEDEDVLSSSDESSGRPIPRYVGRDTDHVFGEFEMDDEDVVMRREDGYGEDETDEDYFDEEEPVAELLPLGGGTRRVPRTPGRKNSSKCGFFDYYKLTDEHLGSGAYGSVTTCKSIKSGVEYAVKIVDKQGETHSRKRILREVNIFKTCKDHPNIVQLLDWFEDETNFYLVMEKMRGGPLLQHILQRKYFTEEEARRVTKDISLALKFMHDRGIAHRDVKPENVLCTDPNHVSPVKLCDLDLASQRPPQHERHPLSQVASEPDLASPVGSAEFMAPEVVDAYVGDSLKYDKKCDTWSLGVILYIMLAGYAPFQGMCDDEDCGWSEGKPCEDCQQDLFHRIQDGYYEFPEEEWGMISEEAKDLVSNLLKRDPVDRFNADQILSHRWLQQSAASTILQTPSNLINRKDSARDVQQMSEHFNLMNRLADTRLSARFDNKMTMSECGSDLGTATIHGDGSFLSMGGEPFGTFPRKKSVGIAIEKSRSGEFTPPISRASPTTPPPSMLNLSEDLTDSPVKRRSADDSGTFSLFSPASSNGDDSICSPPMVFVDMPSIQLFGTGALLTSVQMTPRHTTEDDASLKSFEDEQENANPIHRIETQVNV